MLSLNATKVTPVEFQVDYQLPLHLLKRSIPMGFLGATACHCRIEKAFHVFRVKSLPLILSISTSKLYFVHFCRKVPKKLTVAQKY